MSREDGDGLTCDRAGVATTRQTEKRVKCAAHAHEGQASQTIYGNNVVGDRWYVMRWPSETITGKREGGTPPHARTRTRTRTRPGARLEGFAATTRVHLSVDSFH